MPRTFFPLFSHNARNQRLAKKGFPIRPACSRVRCIAWFDRWYPGNRTPLIFLGAAIGGKSSNPLSGIVVLWDRYGAPTQVGTPSAARALLRLTDCGLPISLRTLQHEYHAVASEAMVTPLLGLQRKRWRSLSNHEWRSNGSNQRLATLREPYRPILSRVRCIAWFAAARDQREPPS